MSENERNIKNKAGMDQRIDVAVLGATGVVGQVFVQHLVNHPWFRPAVLTGSGRRDGKNYARQVRWALPDPLPEAAKDLRLENLDVASLKERGIKIIFSALPSDVAAEVEPGLREQGFFVFSNAGALRYEPDVPILIPDANPESLEWIERQGYPESGFVVTNANCSTTGLAVALAPLKEFGLKEIFVSTYQSISGAGYPGLPSMDILGNAVPYIRNEEEKMIEEVQKILDIDAPVFPSCVRIPVVFGHLETVWLTCERQVDASDVLEAWNSYHCPTCHLPTMPKLPVLYRDEPDFPQTRLSFQGEPAGMQVFTGRLRKVGDRIGFTLLVNNLVKGAAGGSIANAELFLDTYGVGSVL